MIPGMQSPPFEFAQAGYPLSECTLYHIGGPARWALFPLGGSTVRLRRQIPYTIAMEMLLTGKRITADEALRYGLIGRVVPDGQALATALEVAAQIAENGPLAVQAIKRSVMETEGLPEAEALKKELEIK